MAFKNFLASTLVLNSFQSHYVLGIELRRAEAQNLQILGFHQRAGSRLTKEREYF